jgi:hypothetical protein
MIDLEDPMTIQAQQDEAGRESAPSSQEPKQQPARQYADPIDEDALHDQLMIAMMSEEPAHEASGLPAQYDTSQGQGMPFDLVDPIIRNRKPSE